MKREILAIKTEKHREVRDITNDVNIALKKVKLEDGLAHLFLKHTTAAVTTADLDPGTDLDMLDAFGEIVPQNPSGGKYRHPHDPGHVPDHILSSLIGTSLVLPVEKGQLILGEWQRVILIEFDGPRERRIVISFIGE